jgi:2'-5' RNA ligase
MITQGAAGGNVERFAKPHYNPRMDAIRAFIAIDLPPAVKDALGGVTHALGERVARGAVRWVRPEQMHLTLNFLGDTPLDRLPAVRQAMDAAGRSKPFALQLDGVGCFPNRSRPRVVWVGLAAAGGGASAPLLALKMALDETLAPLGWPPEARPFTAHLTLGRVKDERGARGVDWTADVPGLEIPVTAIHLIESQLRPDGPIYTVRHTSNL